MALFKKTDSKKKEEKKVEASVMPVIGSKDVLRAPRITEKASDLQMKGIYVFEVSPDATKNDVLTAVKKAYNVTPRSVRMVAIPQKSVRHMRSGRTGVKGGGKKAYVYLKAGDSITLA